MKTIRRKNPGAVPKAHQQTLDRIEFLAEQSMQTSKEVIALVDKLRGELAAEEEDGDDPRTTPERS